MTRSPFAVTLLVALFATACVESSTKPAPPRPHPAPTSVSAPDESEVDGEDLERELDSLEEELREPSESPRPESDEPTSQQPGSTSMLDHALDGLAAQVAILALVAAPFSAATPRASR